MNLTRADLYFVVWKIPIIRLKDLIGITDTGLTKRLKALDIPVPPRGHWAREKAGQRVSQPPLPNPEQQFVIHSGTWRGIMSTLAELKAQKSVIQQKIEENQGSPSPITVDDEQMNSAMRTLRQHGQDIPGTDVKKLRDVQVHMDNEGMSAPQEEDSAATTQPEVVQEAPNVSGRIAQVFDLPRLKDMAAAFDLMCAARRVIESAEMELPKLPSPAAGILQLWIIMAKKELNILDPVAALTNWCINDACQTTFGHS